MNIKVIIGSYKENSNNAFILVASAAEYSGWYYIEKGEDRQALTEFYLYKASYYRDAKGETHFNKEDYFDTMLYVNKPLGDSPSMYQALEFLKDFFYWKLAAEFPKED